MPLNLIARPSGILVPRDDFGLKGIPSRDLVFGDDIGYVASLQLGYDGTQPRLVKIDAAGNLRVTTAGASALNGIDIASAGGLALTFNGTGEPGGVNAVKVPVAGFNRVYNGADWNLARSASAANLAAQSGLGAALTDQPGDWSVFSAPAVSVAASASRAAGGAGVRHVCTGLTFGFSATTALAAIVTATVNLRDGATGAGTILKSLQFTLPAGVVAPFAIQLTGLHLIGSAATAMTVEFAAAIGNLLTFCDLSGHDAS